MRTFIICERKHQLEIPERFKEYDNRSPDSVVEYFIKEFSKPDDTVLDIFAGLGTTLIVAERLNRLPYGVEYLEDRYKYILSKIQHKENMINGDARKLFDYKFPPIDFVFTSPIFMSKNETKDPLNGFKTEGNYTKYLNDIQKIFKVLKNILKPNSYVAVMVANLKIDGITTLAWDVGKALSEVLNFEGEVIIGWKGSIERESFNYDHSYCLIFKNRV